MSTETATCPFCRQETILSLPYHVLGIVNHFLAGFLCVRTLSFLSVLGNGFLKRPASCTMSSKDAVIMRATVVCGNPIKGNQANVNQCLGDLVSFCTLIAKRWEKQVFNCCWLSYAHIPLIWMLAQVKNNLLFSLFNCIAWQRETNLAIELLFPICWMLMFAGIHTNHLSEQNNIQHTFHPG